MQLYFVIFLTKLLFWKAFPGECGERKKPPGFNEFAKEICKNKFRTFFYEEMKIWYGVQLLLLDFSPTLEFQPEIKY